MIPMHFLHMIDNFIFISTNQFIHIFTQMEFYEKWTFTAVLTFVKASHGFAMGEGAVEQDEVGDVFVLQ